MGCAFENIAFGYLCQAQMLSSTRGDVTACLSAGVSSNDLAYNTETSQGCRLSFLQTQLPPRVLWSLLLDHVGVAHDGTCAGLCPFAK